MAINETLYGIKVQDKQGIGMHSRPIAHIVGALSRKNLQNTKIEVVKLSDDSDIAHPLLNGQETRMNAKSVVSFISLKITNDSKICFIISGENHDQAIKSLKVALKEAGMV